MFDIIIKNGTIVDGMGRPAYQGDVAIGEGKILGIAAKGGLAGDAGEVIDAAGLVVSPGFIDTHTHSDKSGLKPAKAWNYLEQGVTTRIAGQCGSSPAPSGDREELIIDLGLDPQGDPEGTEAAIRACQSPGAFMDAAGKGAFATNMAFLLGHGAVRGHAMGYYDAKPSESELKKMKDTIREAMEAGYLGYSSGLAYAPSVYADEWELTELARAIAPYGGVYASHIRNEGTRGEEAVAEAIAVGMGAGVTTLISHLKVVGKQNEGKSVRLLAMIDAANKGGGRVYADQYPFPASSAPLADQIPPFFHEGGRKALLSRLRDKDARKAMLEMINDENAPFESALRTAGFEGAVVVGAAKTPEAVGKSIAELAAETGKTPMDALCDLLIENECGGGGIYFSQNESDMLRIMAHPRVMGGSDWSDIAAAFDEERKGGCHPRGTATMPRRLELCRDKGLRSLEDSVRSVTALPAEVMGLKGQGVLQEGYDACVTVFDYKSVAARADFMYPFRKSAGIHTVIVNGRVAVTGGRATGVMAGRLLKRSR